MTVTRTAKKQVWISKATVLDEHHTFLFISLPLSLHDNDVKIPNFTFWGGRKHEKMIF